MALEIFRAQRPNGSWGGGVASTLISQMSLQHAGEAFPRLKSTFAIAIEMGQRFNSTRTLESRDSAYLGVAVDGRYWDTAFVCQTLADLGVDQKELQTSAQALLKMRDSSGGYAFGIDFENTDMDNDDTAEVLLFFKKIGFGGEHILESLRWLVEMQNDDGGWGAFSKNNVGNWFLRKNARTLETTVDPFDESSADVTAHVLEALMAFKEYSDLTAVIGLRRAGVDRHDLTLVKADEWIKGCQNSDGGFGETFSSYANPWLKCKGLSTPTQTAWALLALLETNDWYHPAVTKAAKFLVSNYQDSAGWVDDSVVGTGQPFSMPMQYPVYAKVFPTLALTQFL